MNFYKIFSRLDAKHFKAFLSIIEHGSFSSAAPYAAMTISGLSQHIAALEEALDVSLFQRTVKGCLITDEGKKLFDFIQKYTDLVSDLSNSISNSQDYLGGVTRYAMPPSCILSPHFPQLLEKIKKHPDLKLNVTLCDNNNIIKSLLEGQLDFAFVTEKVVNNQLDYREFCEEEYILVGANVDKLSAISEDNFIDQKFISYPGFHCYCDFWIEHFFPNLKNIDSRSFSNFSGEINTIDGGIKMVSGGIGLSIFPRHCVQELLEQKKLFEYVSEKPPLLNTIYVAMLKKGSIPKRVQKIIGWFMEMVR